MFLNTLYEIYHLFSDTILNIDMLNKKKINMMFKYDSCFGDFTPFIFEMQMSMSKY